MKNTCKPANAKVNATTISKFILELLPFLNVQALCTAPNIITKLLTNATFFWQAVQLFLHSSTNIHGLEIKVIHRSTVDKEHVPLFQ